jgi:hypothetical protein
MMKMPAAPPMQASAMVETAVATGNSAAAADRPIRRPINVLTTPHASVTKPSTSFVPGTSTSTCNPWTELKVAQLCVDASNVRRPPTATSMARLLTVSGPRRSGGLRISSGRRVAMRDGVAFEGHGGDGRDGENHQGHDCDLRHRGLVG